MSLLRLQIDGERILHGLVSHLNFFNSHRNCSSMEIFRRNEWISLLHRLQFFRLYTYTHISYLSFEKSTIILYPSVSSSSAHCLFLLFLYFFLLYSFYARSTWETLVSLRDGWLEHSNGWEYEENLLALGWLEWIFKWWIEVQMK